MIVVDVEVAVFCVSIQSDPVSAGGTYSWANRTLWQGLNRPVFQPTANRFENWFAVLLT
jgi:hypothetical protein